MISILSLTLTLSLTSTCLPPDSSSSLQHRSAEASIVLIQVKKKPEASSESPAPKRLPPSRRGSIIVYDDQPFSFLPSASSEVSLNASTPASTDTLPVVGWESAKLYKPPTFTSRFLNESEVPPPVVKDTLIIEDHPRGTISTVWINMMKQGLSEWLRIPVIVARGTGDGYDSVWD